MVCELEDRDYHREVNVFWVPEAARWENLRAQAKQPDIGKRIDDALTLIETENPKLKGILGKLETALSGNGHSPTIATLKKYAQAVGCKLEVHLVPSNAV